MKILQLLAPTLFAFLCTAKQDAQEFNPDQWTEVPVRIVDALALESNAFGANDSFVKPEAVGTSARFASDALHVFITNHDGYSSDTLYLRFAPGVDGALRAWTRGERYSDVGPITSQIVDLVGLLEIEARELGEDAPLRVRFDLVGIGLGYGTCDSQRLRGGLVVEAPSGLFAIQSANSSGAHRVNENATSELTPMLHCWQSGMPRAFGHVNSHGARVGRWTTWSKDGARQSVTHFEDGVRVGAWRGFDDVGAPGNVGQLEDGLCSGPWAETGTVRGVPVVRRGDYVAHLRTGIWSAKAVADDTVLEQGEWVAGRKRGVWTEWWPNGNRRSEFLYNVKGYVQGPYKKWNADGELAEEGVRKPPAWFREDQ